MNLQTLFRFALCIAAFGLSTSATIAQSTDRNNPTPVTTKIINGNGVDEKTEYYYSIPAGVGDLTLDLEVKAAKEAAVSSVDISVLNKKSETLVATYANPDHGSSKHATRTIKSKGPQTLLLVVEISPGVDNFTITLDGALDLTDAIVMGGTAPSPAQLGNQPPSGGSSDQAADLSNQTLEGEGGKVKTEHVYSFSAGPGELKLMLCVNSLGNAAVSSVDIELLNERSQQLAAGFANPSFGSSMQKVVTAKLTHTQTLVLKIIVSPGVDTYALQLSGPMNGVLHGEQSQ
jgi:hypothetical protein